MATFTTYIKATNAITRKEWIKQRRASKSDGSTVIVDRVGAGGPWLTGANVGGDNGAGDEALALLNDMFERVNIGTDDEPVYAIRAKYGFFSDSFVSAGGMNTTE